MLAPFALGVDDIEPIAGRFAFTGADKYAFLDEVVQIARCCRARGAYDRDVVFSAQAALESFDAFAENAGENFFLPCVQRATHLVIELGFLDKELDRLLCIVLRRQYRFCEIGEPVVDLVVFVVAFQRVVVGLFALLDGMGKRDQRRLSQGLCQGFLSQTTRDPTIAVFKRMNTNEIDMRDASARQGR